MTEILRKRLDAALAGRYRVEREVGAGGMALVYLAHDVRHDRDVALKVLRLELSAVLGVERFLHEIRVSARLDHPHILTLIDSGQSDGLLWYVLPYLRGESLRQKLKREQQLGLEEALAITRQVASALAYAHGLGVIHRDVKPDNILFREGEAVLADFGIALAVREAGGHRLTASGLSLGTPQYMSPEQATGSREVDARSDVYSLAAVLYEMLAGEPPHSGATAQVVIAKLLAERPTRLRTVRDTVPEAVDEAVAKALAKVPADRFRSATAFVAALEAPAAAPRGHPRRRTVGARLGLAAVGIAVVAFLIRLLFRGGGPPPVPVERQVTFRGDIVQAELSPDGAFVAYVAATDSGMSLVSQDMVSRSTVTLVARARRIMSLSWAPDAGSMLAGVFDTSGRGSVDAYPRLGGTPQHLRDGLGVAQWTTDGTQLIWWNENSRGPAFFTPSSGQRILVPLPDTTGWIEDVRQDPSRPEAFVVLKWDASYRGTLWRLVVDSARRHARPATDSALGRVLDSPRVEPNEATVLLREAAQLAAPRWSPRGDALYYLRAREGLYELWKLPTTADGRPRGRPRLLVSGLEVPEGEFPHHAISFDARGTKLAYIQGGEFSNLWRIERQDGGWRTRALTNGTGAMSNARVSPDGRQIAFLATEAGRSNVFVMPGEGGTPRQVTYLDSVLGEPVWSADGRFLAFAIRQSGGNRVARVALADPSLPRVYARTDVGAGGRLEWAPGRDILYQRANAQNFYLLDPVTEDERPLLSPDSAALGWVLGARYSPDGERVAVSWNRIDNDADGLYVVSLTNGSHTKLIGPGFPMPLGWSADGRLVYVLPFGTGAGQELWGVPMDGGPRVLVTPLPFAPDWIGTTYRGEWFVLAASGRRGDVHMIEHFDPDVR
jgi:Tol biopolymer transport system component